MEQEISLREIIGVFKKRLLLLLIILVLGLSVSAGLNFYVFTPVYEASTTLLVGRDPDQGQIVYQDILLLRQLVKTYSEIATSRSVLTDVIEALGLDLSPDQLRSQISVSAVGDTEIIAIKALHECPVYAMKIANQTARSFSAKVVNYSIIQNVTVVDQAVVPGSPIRPNIKLNMVLAGMLSLMAGVGLVFVLEYLDNTFKTTDEIVSVLGLNVMATIPQEEKGR